MEDRRLVFSLGASDYLAKPYNRAELITKVHRLLPELRDRKILVVDDDPKVCTMLAKMLEDESAIVTGVTSGQEALARIAQAPPDLVLLDLMMPGMSGFEVVARMRATATGLNIPVVIVSAKALTDEDVRTLNGHIQRFIAKGDMQITGLVTAIRQVLGQSLNRPGQEAA